MSGEGATKTCRKCGGPIKNGKCVRNGCDQFTAMPTGQMYQDKSYIQTGSDGKAWNVGGNTGNMRAVPTCKE